MMWLKPTSSTMVTGICNNKTRQAVVPNRVFRLPVDCDTEGSRAAVRVMDITQFIRFSWACNVKGWTASGW